MVSDFAPSSSPFFLEVLSAEIPARFQAQARIDAKKTFAQLIKPWAEISDIETWITPRRLVLAAKLRPIQREATPKRGPRSDAPQEVVQHFLNSLGGQKAISAWIEETPKGSFWFGKPAHQQSLFEERLVDLLETWITDFPWPRRMRWASESVLWIRPILSIQVLWEEKPLLLKRFSHLMHPESRASSDAHQPYAFSYGHPIMAPEPLCYRSVTDYQEKLQQAFVMLSSEQRLQHIQKTIQEICATQWRLAPQDQEPGGLLEEIVGLTEWPNGVLVPFLEEALLLPEEVVAHTLRIHQKVLPLWDQQSGKLVPYALAFANSLFQDKGKTFGQGVRRGIESRLKDALFFWQTDQKKSLDDHAAQLDKRLVFEGLGTLLDKTKRLIKLAEWAYQHHQAPQDCIRAAALSQADLVTQMVQEFPELQGRIGSYYAQNQGESSSVVTLLRDFRGSPKLSLKKDNSGWSATSWLIWIDRLDTLVGFIALGKKPTGSKDPLGLRRIAHHLTLLALQAPQHLVLDAWIKEVLNAYQIQGYLQKSDREQIALVIQNMMQERAEHWATEAGITPVLYRAIMNRKDPQKSWRDTYHALQIWSPWYETMPEKTLSLIKRLAHLCRETEHPIWPGIWETPQETRLFAWISQEITPFNMALFLIDLEDFLNHIRVHAENPEQTRHRLSLVSCLWQKLSWILNWEVLWLFSAR